MFWFALVCGWGLTAASIALMWIYSRPGRSLLAGLGIGIAAGVLWPVTIWVAIGAWLYTRASRRSGHEPVDHASIASQLEQAEAFARQAEIEGMTASAEYWRAESQRLAAQEHGPTTKAAHPASTGLIVVGCTVACLAGIGALWFTAPSLEAAAIAAPAPWTPTGPAAPAPAEPARTDLGNIAKRYDEIASVIGGDGGVIAEFTIGSPTAATCNPFSEAPTNDRFIRLPVTLKTFDDPYDQLTLLDLGGPWEYVSADGRSREASTSAAAACGFDRPTLLGPNRSYEFAVVLDIPAAPGVLVLNTLFADGGWEWAYTG